MQLGQSAKRIASGIVALTLTFSTLGATVSAAPVLDPVGPMIVDLQATKLNYTAGDLVPITAMLANISNVDDEGLNRLRVSFTYDASRLEIATRSDDSTKLDASSYTLNPAFANPSEYGVITNHFVTNGEGYIEFAIEGLSAGWIGSDDGMGSDLGSALIGTATSSLVTFNFHAKANAPSNTVSFVLDSMTTDGYLSDEVTPIYGNTGITLINETVNIASAQVLTDLQIAPASLSIDIDSLGLNVGLYAIYNNSNSVDVSADPRTVWTSSNEAAATVSPTGIAVPVAAGSTIITGQFGGMSRSMNLTVTETNSSTPTITNVNYNASLINSHVGVTHQMEVTAQYTDFSWENITAQASFDTDDITVATVTDQGLITAVGVGTTKIRVNVAGQPEHEVTVNVTNPSASSSNKALLSVTVDGHPATIDEQAKTVTVIFPSGYSSDHGTLIATSNGESLLYNGSLVVGNPSIALPAPQGSYFIVEALDGSEAVYSFVTQIASDQASYKELRFMLSGTNPTDLTQGDTTQIVARAVLNDGQDTEVVVTDQATWTSSDDDVATVTNGLVTGVAAGTARITANYGNVSLYVDITVGTPQAITHKFLTAALDGHAGVVNQDDHTIHITVPHDYTFTDSAELTFTHDGQTVHYITISGGSQVWTSPKTFMVDPVGFIGLLTVSGTGSSNTYQLAIDRQDPPTDPVDPVDPIDPIDPVDPTDPTDPTDPPTDPTTPVDPTVPTEPSVPATPAEPAPETNIFNSDVVAGDINVVESIKAQVEASKNLAPERAPADIKGHWAEKTVDTFVKLGVIKGYENGMAKPDQNISRAEFVSILSRIFDVKGSKQVQFSDAANHWASEAITEFAAAGIISGNGKGSFEPNKQISREEMVIIISRIINLQGTAKDMTKGEFADLDNSYAKDAIAQAAQAGIISGKGDKMFDPKASSTRAEALQIILNTLNLNPDIKTLLDTL